MAPFAAAICDRGFSEQNLIITKRRTSILTPLLRDLMMICLNGQKWSDADELLRVLMDALKLWSKNKLYDQYWPCLQLFSSALFFFLLNLQFII